MSKCLHGSQAGEKIAELHGFLKLGCVVSDRVLGWWMIPIPERLGCNPSWLTNSRGAVWHSIQSTVCCSIYDVSVYTIYMWDLDRKRHTNYCVSHEVLLDGSLLDSDPKKSGLGRQKNFLVAFGWMFPEWFNSNEVKWHPQRIKKPLVHMKIWIISGFGWMPSTTFLIYFGIHWDFRTVQFDHTLRKTPCERVTYDKAHAWGKQH